MASSHHNPHSEAAKKEQIVTEFFAKSLHIILESRSPYLSSRNYSCEQTVSSPSSSSSSSSSVRPRDKWFHLALGECPSALENLDIWRQNSLEPLVVDVVLEQRPLDWQPTKFSPKRDLVWNSSGKEKCQFGWKSDQEELGGEPKSEKIIERWVVQYNSRKSRDCNTGSRRSSSNTLAVLYKKAMLLLRSLYVTVRLLPAYKIFRDLNSSCQIRTFKLVPKVSSFAEPFTHKEDAEMQRFGFTPVDTSCGRLCLSVLYRSSLLDISSESLTPLSPKFIKDYVGSPLADPLKRFTSLPASHGSSSSLPFSRRHSWSFDRYRASPPSVSFSPSPTHSEPHALASNPSSRRFSPMGLPPHPPEMSSVHKKDMHFDECFLSPNFTPSPSPSASPSPPIQIPGSHLLKGLLRSESAPVNIPIAKLPNSPVCKQNVFPSPPVKLERCSSSKLDKNSGPTKTGTTEKLFALGKDDTRKYSGLKLSSNSSTQVASSRSFSRSFQDDFDDFPCHFDVEDDFPCPFDRVGAGSRPESFDQRGPQDEPSEAGGFLPIRKSEDAAVGVLVQMLQKAPPLRQDTSINLAESSRPAIWDNSVEEPNQISEAPGVQYGASASVVSSALTGSRTTADALEELWSYKEMKNLLLSQGGRSYTSQNYASTSEPSSRGTTRF